MSLAIAVKSAEGIVLAADSRVTLFGTRILPLAGQNTIIAFPASYDNAVKMLSVQNQPHVGAVTFGAGTIGATRPRTASSFLPEFESKLGHERLSVHEFAKQLGEFFVEQWNKYGMPAAPPLNENMVFFVGGYDQNEPYGRLFTLSIPGAVEPTEVAPDDFGVHWGGQMEITTRLLSGFDPGLPTKVCELLNLDPKTKASEVESQLKNSFGLPVPWVSLPLQDCVDLATFLVSTTIQLQEFLVAIRGVGGEVDVATITRLDGFRALKLKQIRVPNGRSLRDAF